jgi:hypothetical protein
MKLSFITVVLGAALATLSCTASAQFGGLLKGNSSGSGVSAEQIVKRYVGGARNVMQANANMLDAVGLKTEAGQAAAQVANLTEGATKDALEDANKTQTENSKALEMKLSDSKTTLDAGAKKKFSAGLGDLAKGVIQYVGLAKEVGGFKPGMGSINATGNSALFVAKSLPGSTKNLAQTLKMAIEFSKANDIPVPKEANDATAMI